MRYAAWRVEYSVEADVSTSFAWTWRTDIRSWDDPPAQFRLEGRFADGTWGTTQLPGQAPLRWQIRDVRRGESFTIDMPLDGAVLSFEWTFEPVLSCRTRITQRITLSGENAAIYEEHVRNTFARTLSDGMKRIRAALLAAHRQHTAGKTGNREDAKC
jgi:hypothetical protein